jgi:hypothetical protein
MKVLYVLGFMCVMRLFKELSMPIKEAIFSLLIYVHSAENFLWLIPSI